MYYYSSILTFSAGPSRIFINFQFNYMIWAQFHEYRRSLRMLPWTRIPFSVARFSSSGIRYAVLPSVLPYISTKILFFVVTRSPGIISYCTPLFWLVGVISFSFLIHLPFYNFFTPYCHFNIKFFAISFSGLYTYLHCHFDFLAVISLSLQNAINEVFTIMETVHVGLCWWAMLGFTKIKFFFFYLFILKEIYREIYSDKT